MTTLSRRAGRRIAPKRPPNSPPPTRTGRVRLRLPSHIYGRVLTRAEGRRLFDRAARRNLGISGDEFLRRWDAGEYRDRIEDHDVTMVYPLIGFARGYGIPGKRSA